MNHRVRFCLITFLILVLFNMLIRADSNLSIDNLQKRMAYIRKNMSLHENDFEQKLTAKFKLDQERVIQFLDMTKAFLDEAKVYLDLNDLYEADLRITFAETMLKKTLVPLATSPLVEGRIISLDAATLSQKAMANKIADLVEEIAIANFNTIFVEVIRGDGYAVYPSKFQVQAEELLGQDPLLELIARAKQYEIDVFPWVKMFFATSNKTPGPILINYPEWKALDRYGKGYEKAGLVWYNPAHPQARDFIYNSILELFQNYDFAGCQLDYVRYPVNLTEDNDFSYDAYSRELFRSIYGIDPINIPYIPYSIRAQSDYQRGDSGSLFASWLSFREEMVSSLVGRVSIALRTIKPDLPISIGIITALWGGGTIQQAWFRMQNWPIWLENHYANYLSPMIYQDDANVVEREVKALTNLAQNRALQYPSLGVHAMTDPYQLIEQIEIIRTNGIAGMRVFAYPHLKQEHFKALIEGPFREKAIPPHRDVIKASLLRANELTDLFPQETDLISLVQALERIPKNHGYSRYNTIKRALTTAEKLGKIENQRIQYELNYICSYLEVALYTERLYK